MAPLLSLSLRPSYHLATILVLAHALAGAAVTSVDFPLPVMIGSWFVIGANCGFVVYRSALLKSARSIVSLELRGGNEVTFIERSGRAYKGRVLDSSFVAPYLTVLNLGAGNGQVVRHALILPDSLEPDEFRRLRVRLRWARSATAR